MVVGNLVAACEGLLVGSAFGLDALRLIDALGGGAASSWQLQNLGPRIVARDFAPGFRVRLARKDLRLVLEAARDAGLPLPGVELAQQLLDTVAASGGDRLGTQALVTALEAMAGRKVGGADS
jgi:3-hydroxyisobutyrate dehydrogenase